MKMPSNTFTRHFGTVLINVFHKTSGCSSCVAAVDIVIKKLPVCNQVMLFEVGLFVMLCKYFIYSMYMLHWTGRE